MNLARCVRTRVFASLAVTALSAAGDGQQAQQKPISSSSWRRHRLQEHHAYNRGMMAIARQTSIASQTRARSSPTITASNPAQPDARRSSPAKSPFAHRAPESRAARSEGGVVGARSDYCRSTEAAGLRDRTVRQEPPWRPQRIPPDGSRLRTIFRNLYI